MIVQYWKRQNSISFINGILIIFEFDSSSKNVAQNQEEETSVQLLLLDVWS